MVATGHAFDPLHSVNTVLQVCAITNALRHVQWLNMVAKYDDIRPDRDRLPGAEDPLRRKALAQTMWRFALQAVHREVKARHFGWRTIQDYAHRSKEYIDFYKRKSAHLFPVLAGKPNRQTPKPSAPADDRSQGNTVLLDETAVQAAKAASGTDGHSQLDLRWAREFVQLWRAYAAAVQSSECTPADVDAKYASVQAFLSEPAQPQIRSDGYAALQPGEFARCQELEAWLPIQLVKDCRKAAVRRLRHEVHLVQMQQRMLRTPKAGQCDATNTAADSSDCSSASAAGGVARGAFGWVSSWWYGSEAEASVIGDVTVPKDAQAELLSIIDFDPEAPAGRMPEPYVHLQLSASIPSVVIAAELPVGNTVEVCATLHAVTVRTGHPSHCAQPHHR